MHIETRAFGPVEIKADQVISLTEPMPGFTGFTRFAVLNPDPDSPFSYLQSVDRAELCFLLADPQQFFPDYQVELKQAAVQDLAIAAGTQTAVAVIVTVPEDPAKATANLLAPVVFNVQEKVARQVILEGSGYPVRQPLFQEEKKVSNGP